MNLISLFPATTRRPANIAHAIDSMFNNFLDQDFPVSFRDGSIQKSPAVNIVESDSGYRIEVAAPGLNKEDFEIKVENELLSISAKKETKEETKEETFTRREFSYVEFKRNFNLPKTVDANAIKASYENGVLSIALEKKPEARPVTPKMIEIA